MTAFLIRDRRNYEVLNWVVLSCWSHCSRLSREDKERQCLRFNLCQEKFDCLVAFSQARGGCHAALHTNF